MNDFVTFYYPPDRQGETLYLELAAPSGSSKAVFFSNGALQSSLGLKSNRFEDADSYRRALSRAAELIKKQGGLMVEWSGGRYRVGLYAASGYAPPSSLLLLSLSGIPRKVAIESGREAARDASQRLVAAVNQDAQRHLEALLGQLTGFPDDIQSVLFNAMRRPALEARLSRLEERLAATSPARAGAAAASRKKDWPAFLQPWVVAPALVSLVFLFILVGIYSANWGISGFSPLPFLSASSEPETQPAGPQADPGTTANGGAEGSSGPSGETSQPPQPPPPPPLLSLPDPDLKEPVAQLLAAWAQCGAETPAGKVYQTHLAPLLTAHGNDLDAVLGQEDAAWGLAKLHGLAAGLTLPNTALTRTDHRSALKSRLQNDGVPPALQPTFAYFGCLAFAQPGLKEYPGDTLPEAFVLESPDCQSIDRQAALAALDQLTGFVRSQSGPGSQ
ncbi:MAG: hypothetical protein V3T83_07585 [Acidobacteriota bacterium]